MGDDLSCQQGIRVDKAVKVLDSEDKVLFEADLSNIEEAWNFAANMEQYGVEVRLESPSLPETLASSLGMKERDREKLRASIIHEIEEHDLGCCLQKEDENPTI